MSGSECLFCPVSFGGIEFFFFGGVSSCVKDVEQLARYYGRSPDKIALEEIRDYMHYLIVEKKYSYSYCNHKLVAINFFNREVLGRKINLRVPTKRSKDCRNRLAVTKLRD